MKFPFPTFPTTLPVPSLGGAMFRPKPLIPIRLFGPGGQWRDRIMVDTGADDVVFPMQLATMLGAKLDHTTGRQAAGVGSRQPVGLLYAPMILELSDSIRVCRWRAVVAFTTGKLLFPLLGFAGGLEFFRSTLDVDAGEIILEPKPRLPTTQDAAP